MKVKCPKCNTMGFLEKRGNSFRIKHYKGYVNYRRKYIIHSLNQEDAFRMGINHQSEAKSLDQASRQPLNQSLTPLKDNLLLIIKALTKVQHLSKAN